MRIPENFETEEDDKALEKAEITDIFSQEVQGDLPVDIQGFDSSNLPSFCGTKIQ